MYQILGDEKKSRKHYLKGIRVNKRWVTLGPEDRDIVGQYDDAQEDGKSKAFLRRVVAEFGTPNVAHDCLSLLYSAALRGDLAGVQFLLDEGAETRTRDDRILNAIFAGVASGSPEVVKLLIGRGCPVNIQGSNGSTPILNAAIREDLEIVEILLEAGADPSIKNIANHDALSVEIHHSKAPELEALFRRYGFEPQLRIQEKSGLEELEEWRARERKKKTKSKSSVRRTRKKAAKKTAAKRKVAKKNVSTKKTTRKKLAKKQARKKK